MKEFVIYNRMFTKINKSLCRSEKDVTVPKTQIEIEKQKISDFCKTLNKTHPLG